MLQQCRKAVSQNNGHVIFDKSWHDLPVAATFGPSCRARWKNWSSAVRGRTRPRTSPNRRREPEPTSSSWVRNWEEKKILHLAPIKGTCQHPFDEGLKGKSDQSNPKSKGEETDPWSLELFKGCCFSKIKSGEGRLRVNESTNKSRLIISYFDWLWFKSRVFLLSLYGKTMFLFMAVSCRTERVIFVLCGWERWQSFCCMEGKHNYRVVRKVSRNILLRFLLKALVGYSRSHQPFLPSPLWSANFKTKQAQNLWHHTNPYSNC